MKENKKCSFYEEDGLVLGHSLLQVINLWLILLDLLQVGFVYMFCLLGLKVEGLLARKEKCWAKPSRSKYYFSVDLVV